MINKSKLIDTQQLKHKHIQLEVIDMHMQPGKRKILAAIICSAALMSGGVALAGDVTVTNTFVAGQPATASTVNQNFSDVKTAVDDNNVRVTTNTVNVTTNTADIATNTGGVSTNAAGVATNAGEIAINAGEVATNTGTIATNAGDIANNTVNIATNSGNVSTNTTGIVGHETRITTLEAAGGGGGGGTATPVTINCPVSGAIQAAIDSAATAGRLVITINGACSENVVITRNDVTLLGGSSGSITGATTSPTISSTGKIGLEIENLSVNGGLIAMLTKDAATTLITSSTIGNGSTLEVGMIVLGSTTTFVGGTNGNVITGGSDPDEGTGFFAVAGSAVQFKSGNNTVNSGANGIAVECELGTTIASGDVSGTSNFVVNGKSEMIENCNFAVFNGTLNGDIFAEGNSTLTLEAESLESTSVNVIGNVSIKHSSAVLLVGNTASVTGNMDVGLASSAAITENATVSGEVFIRSNSVLSVDFDNVIGTLKCETFSNSYIDAPGLDIAATYIVDGNPPISGDFACGLLFP